MTADFETIMNSIMNEKKLINKKVDKIDDNFINNEEEVDEDYNAVNDCAFYHVIIHLFISILFHFSILNIFSQIKIF